MKKIIYCLILFFVGISVSFAEILNSPTWGYSVDLPEEFVLVDKNGADSYMFENAFVSSTVILKAYKKEKFSSSLEAMETVMKQLGAEFECAETDWRNTDCIISQFAINLGGASNTGWAVSSLLQDSKGYVVMLCYTPTDVFYDLEQFVISCVDSLCIDYGSYYSPGPLTSFAFPKGEVQNHTVEIAGEKIDFPLNSNDIEADRFVVEREYSVLSLYQESERWVEAWQRYYRQVYKNAYSRLNIAAFNIYNRLIKTCESENPEIELAQKLLSWTQGFDYVRDFTSTDFTPITASITGTGSDCDSRAMLLACLLHHMNYDTCLFVSAEFSHSLFGIVLDKAGAKINIDGRQFLLGETTAQVDIGLVPANMNQTDKWIFVELNN
ncbi:MAG: hypothetical protein IKI98_04290 [Spirochaetaceae bacterium]|nr:hypothetical protein [Spirochaetaceae bacterium]